MRLPIVAPVEVEIREVPEVHLAGEIARRALAGITVEQLDEMRRIRERSRMHVAGVVAKAGRR